MGQLKAAFQALPPIVRERPLAAAIRGWAGGISKMAADWLWGNAGCAAAECTNHATSLSTARLPNVILAHNLTNC
jgi:hypothetical protein